jgi:small subunit ribosomal protein S9
MKAKDKQTLTSGKRKSAVARAEIRKGTGNVRINKLPLAVYGSEIERMKIQEPLILSGSLANQVDIQVSVRGGGINGQAEAARLAIGQALVDYSKDKKLEQVFLEYDRQLLVADVRRKETRKPNDSRARAARQKSYR